MPLPALRNRPEEINSPQEARESEPEEGTFFQPQPNSPPAAPVEDSPTAQDEDPYADEEFENYDDDFEEVDEEEEAQHAHEHQPSLPTFNEDAPLRGHASDDLRRQQKAFLLAVAPEPRTLRPISPVSNNNSNNSNNYNNNYNINSNNYNNNNNSARPPTSGGRPPTSAGSSNMGAKGTAEMESLKIALQAENDKARQNRSSTSSPVVSVPSALNGTSSKISSQEVLWTGPKLPERSPVLLDSRVISRMNPVDRRRFQRYNDLRPQLGLCEQYFDMADMPPLTPMEFYTRGFGRSNTSPAFTQSGDDMQSHEVQCDDVQTDEQCCQWPEDAGLGDDSELALKSYQDQKALGDGRLKLAHADPARLLRFLQKASLVFDVLLEENVRQAGGAAAVTTSPSTHPQFSDSFVRVAYDSLLQGRSSRVMCFSDVDPQTLVCAYTRSSIGGTPLAEQGILCVWNLRDAARPTKVLACQGTPSSCCIVSSKSLVVAGTEEGSLSVWDLRETSSMHRSIEINGQSLLVRTPTYCTDGMLGENHNDAVVKVVAFGSSAIANEDGASPDAEPHAHATASDTQGKPTFQLASVDRRGVLNVWLVVELRYSDSNAADTDYALGIGGHVRLLKSSSVALEEHRTLQRRVGYINLYTLDVAFEPTDPNQFILATTLGYPLHCARFGDPSPPLLYDPPASVPIGSVVALSFSPFFTSFYLAAFSTGTVGLYRTDQHLVVRSWEGVSTSPGGLLFIAWSPTRPSVFFVIDTRSVLFVFDLLESVQGPVLRESFQLAVDGSKSPQGVTGMCTIGEKGTASQNMLALSYSDGHVDGHIVNSRFGKSAEDDEIISVLGLFENML